MKKTIATLGIAGTLIGGGIDASSLREAPIEKIEMVASERLEVKQRGNVVETKLPWKGEQGITVKYDMGEPTSKERLKDKRNKQVVTEVVDFGDGGFKVDVILDEKPNTNRFCYQIEGAENYDFFYQPELTEEQKKRGEYRSEDIVGSYAVYHKTLKNNGYKTGKVMHIPRPQVWEVNDESTKEWAELSYTDGELCVTARQEFLDTATYPVRIDPTFGYTTQGASTAQIAGTTTLNPVGILGTLSESGDITSISAYLKYRTTNRDWYGSLYTGSAGSRGSLEGDTDVNFIGSTSFTLNTLNFPSPLSKTAGTYWLHVITDVLGPGTGGSDIAYDTGGASNTGYQESDIGAPVYNTNRYSIYATYTASGGGAPNITSDLIIFE